MSTIEAIKVSDIGDCKGVPLIEVVLKPGDTIEVETPLIYRVICWWSATTKLRLR